MIRPVHPVMATVLVQLAALALALGHHTVVQSCAVGVAALLLRVRDPAGAPVRDVGVTIDGGILSSPDAANWTLRTRHTRGELWSVAYGNGVFVAVGSYTPTNGAYKPATLTSPDGTEWVRHEINGPGAPSNGIPRSRARCLPCPEPVEGV